MQVICYETYLLAHHLCSFVHGSPAFLRISTLRSPPLLAYDAQNKMFFDRHFGYVLLFALSD